MTYIKEIIIKKPIEEIEEPKLDISIFKKKGNSKTFSGYLINKIKEARKLENKELVILLSELYNKYREFNIESFNPRQWRGKSGVKFIEQPEVVISIRFRKKTPSAEPKEIRMELLKSDINRVILAISTLNKGSWIKTRDIAEKIYGKEWKLIFSDRNKHIHLVEILNYLEYKGKIKYSRAGKIKLK